MPLLLVLVLLLAGVAALSMWLLLLLRLLWQRCVGIALRCMDLMVVLQLLLLLLTPQRRPALQAALPLLLAPQLQLGHGSSAAGAGRPRCLLLPLAAARFYSTDTANASTLSTNTGAPSSKAKLL
jgi:hypothetical protein